MLRLLAVAMLAAVPAAASVAPTRSGPIAGCGAPFVGVGAAWSSRDEIAFHTWDADNRLWSIWVVRPDGSDARRVVGPSPRFVGDPAWSPDGRTLAYDNAIGGRIELLDADAGTSRPGPLGGRDPAWSPDGTRLAVAVGGLVPPTDSRIDVVSLDGSYRVTVATDAYRDEGSPSWSAGNTIAYTAESPPLGGESHPFVALVSATGEARRPLAPPSSSSPVGLGPSWSPDGTRIAYTNLVEDLPSTVHVVAADGGGDRAVARDSTPARQNYSAAWSPDGRRLVYTSERFGGEVTNPAPLAIVDATGRGAHPLQPGCRFGTGEADRIRGTARADRIYALEGADTIDVRGGGIDRVSCGAGRDRVAADRRDRVARDCERVARG